MDKITLDRSKLLGFDVAGNLKAKVGVKPSIQGDYVDKIALDRSKLLGFDHPSNLHAKVGAKPTFKPAASPAR